MNIALMGYGKMGKTIEQVALERGHEIVSVFDGPAQVDAFNDASVAIDFSVPDAAVNNIKTAFTAGVPVVCGTTGWLAKYNEVCAFCEEKQSGFVYASNFSLGVNIFFQLNRYLAKLMKPQSQYQPHIEETHHIHKLDAPSGTAISLAEGLIDVGIRKKWMLDKQETDTLTIRAFREGEAPGIHSVIYQSDEDELSITHKAHGRKGFALGAVIAAEWLAGKKGIFTMKDVMQLESF